jgi:hypothetical protein
MRHVAFRVPGSDLETVVDRIVEALIADTPGLEYVIHFYFQPDELLLEAQYRGLPIGGRYSARKDSAHSPSGQVHLHLFAKNNQLAAINIDGTSHDGSNGFPLPTRAADGIRKHFPQFRIPPNNVIEDAPTDIQSLVTDPLNRLLVEEGGA